MWENGGTPLINNLYAGEVLPAPSPALRLMPAVCKWDSTPAFDLIFLGTGTSGSVPNISCLTAPPEQEPCRTCLSTLTPEGKKNIRRNTSAIVRANGTDGKKVYAANSGSSIASIRRLIVVYLHHLRTILIDAGKNFQAAALEWFPKYGLRRIDAVLLTHGHADGKRVYLRCFSRSFYSRPIQPSTVWTTCGVRHVGNSPRVRLPERCVQRGR